MQNTYKKPETLEELQTLYSELHTLENALQEQENLKLCKAEEALTVNYCGVTRARDGAFDLLDTLVSTAGVEITRISTSHIFCNQAPRICIRFVAPSVNATEVIAATLWGGIVQMVEKINER